MPRKKAAPAKQQESDSDEDESVLSFATVHHLDWNLPVQHSEDVRRFFGWAETTMSKWCCHPLRRNRCRPIGRRHFLIITQVVVDWVKAGMDAE